MRRLGHLLMYLVLLAGLGAAGWYFSARPVPEFLTSRADRDKLALIPQATVSLAYIVDSERWLEFDLATGTGSIKLVSNATSADFTALRAARLANPQLRWNYALDIEILGRDGTPLLQRTHHMRTDISEYRLPDGRTYTQSFLLRENLTPLAGVITTLDLGGVPATRLRVRLAKDANRPAEATINDVMLRVYQPDRITEQRAAVAWKRMSRRAQDALVNSSVYPSELLQEREIRNLIMNGMQPIGPRGAEGWDYRGRELYVLFDNQGEIIDDPVNPAGLLADAWVHAIVPITGGGGTVRLQFTPAHPLPGTQARPLPNPPPPADVAFIRWRGRAAFERRDITVKLEKDRPTEFHQHFPDGLLDIQTGREIALRAWQENRASPQQAEQEITPPPTHRPVYAARPNEALSYALEARQEPTVLRLELRRQMSAATPRNTRLRYEVTDADGTSLQAAELSVPLVVSHYDRLLADYSGALLSDPFVCFIALPKNASRIRLFDAEPKHDPTLPLLLTVHTRPWRLAREIHIPDDSPETGPSATRIPAWFVLEPENRDELLHASRNRVLQVQSRPPETAPEILAGRYQWEDIRPLGDGLARPIFTPREPGTPFRDEQLPSVFTALPDGQWTTLNLPAFQGSESIAPNLVWIGADAAVRLGVEIDEAPAISVPLAGPYAEWQLPPLAAGRHRVRIHSSVRGRVLVNHVQPGPDAWLRRLVQRFDTRLVFEVQRREAIEETLTLRLFQPAGQAAAELRVQVEAPPVAFFKPLQGWIFAERHLHALAERRFTAPIFDTRGAQSDAGQPAYLPFTADAPLGRYRITVSAPPGVIGYLAMGRLGPQNRPQRQVRFETESRHVQIPE